TNVVGAYQSLGIAGVADAVYGGTSNANGGALQLTTVYGFRGGYTHNWDAFWNTSVFGAWGAIRYNDTAKSLICLGGPGGAVTGFAGVTHSADFTCNPDFNIAQIGTRTIWTPVKNLSFLGEVVYTQLDQKFTGTINPGAMAAVAKPGANYELKDQGT